MSLRLKINLVMGLLTLLFASAVIALQFRSMRESVAEETLAANRVAAQMLNRTVWLYAARGAPAMLAFLQGMGRVRSNDITLYDAEGRELYRSPPSPYKAGRDAPDWFERLISPPPSEQSIQFPDGKLVVRANATRAALDAWDYLVVLVTASLGLLLAVNALVFWIVGRTARPFGRIVAALDEVQAGRFDVALPPLAGREAGAIGAAFNRMLGVLRENIENERRAIRAESQLSESRELRRWIDHHVEQERRLIARELHDELGQSVTAIRSMALSVAQRVQATDAESAQAARLIADESSRLYDAMHGLIPRLAPLVLDSLGLAEALDDLVERTRRSQQGALQVELHVDLRGAELSADAGLALYRAAQEGITNALRHGQARRIEVRLQAGEGEDVRLEVVDDGHGLAQDALSQRSGHHGLRWLAERVHGLGGAFAIEPALPHGVRLAVNVPRRATEAAEAPPTMPALQAPA
jgi:two-component system, NarL family, sensor histidine kinase UhpB